MAATIIVPDVSIEYGADALSFAVPDGLIAFHLLTGGRTNALRNWADDSKPAAIHGAPVEHDGYLGLDGTNYLELGVLASGDVTMMVLCRGDDTYAAGATLPMYMSTYYSGTAPGVGIYASSSQNIKANAQYVKDGVMQNLVVGTGTTYDTPDQWAARVIAADNAGAMLTNMVSGVSLSGAPLSGSVRQDNGFKVCVGSGRNVGFKGKSRAALALVWNRVLSASERSDANVQLNAIANAAGTFG